MLKIWYGNFDFHFCDAIILQIHLLYLCWRYWNIEFWPATIFFLSMEKCIKLDYTKLAQLYQVLILFLPKVLFQFLHTDLQIKGFHLAPRLIWLHVLLWEIWACNGLTQVIPYLLYKAMSTKLYPDVYDLYYFHCNTIQEDDEISLSIVEMKVPLWIFSALIMK